VELWADGGLRSGADALKMIFLGADRVGMGTAALMGISCISCQRCHLDTCPRGISTQLRTKADAEQRGVKGFTPLQAGRGNRQPGAAVHLYRRGNAPFWRTWASAGSGTWSDARSFWPRYPIKIPLWP
jgi:hypothetical protein